jgi:hypothetical protein
MVATRRRVHHDISRVNQYESHSIVHGTTVGIVVKVDEDIQTASERRRDFASPRREHLMGIVPTVADPVKAEVYPLGRDVVGMVRDEVVDA